MSLAETLLSKRCEVCGRQALYGVRDTREAEPVEVRGRLYLTRKLLEEHFYCNLHRRAPVRRRQDGSVVVPGEVYVKGNLTEIRGEFGQVQARAVRLGLIEPGRG